MTIRWTETTKKLSELKPYERNPRRISKEAYAKLKNSLQQLGYHQRLICQPDGRIIGGHQRLKALKELGVKEIACLVPDRELTPDEFRRLLVTDNLPFGEFDFDILSADFDVQELVEWGFPENLLVDVANGFTPTVDDEQPRLDEKEPKIIKCPHCGKNFDANKA